VVTGANPEAATCRVVDAETGEPVPVRPCGEMDGQRHFMVTVPRAHFYEIVVDGGGKSPVRRMVLAVSDDYEEA
jgi:hypothetical protein